ncbi:MAG: 4-fold beta flower protein [Fimbriimonas sp.]
MERYNKKVTNWLYNSKGRPIAFKDGRNVFSRKGKFLGQIEGEDVWNGRYFATIVDGDTILCKLEPPGEPRSAPAPPGAPLTPGLPSDRAGKTLRGGYRDLSL